MANECATTKAAKVKVDLQISSSTYVLFLNSLNYSGKASPEVTRKPQASYHHKKAKAYIIMMISTNNTTMKRPIQPSQEMHAVPKNKKPRTEVTSPVSYLKSVFGTAALEKLSPKSFLKPDEEDIAAYDMEVVKAVRSCNVEKLKQMFAEGKNLNACNQFGESLLHMACRRGDLPIVSFMVREAKVRVDICDDFGRNPFHDTCWTSTPNLEVMDVLIEVADPFMMLSEDVRGSSPFDYARKEHFAKWVQYIESRRVSLQAKIKLGQPTTTTR
jgi:hypothetical protein